MPLNTLQTNSFLVLKETFIQCILSYYTCRTSVYELLIIMIVTFRLISLYYILVHGYSYHKRFSFFTRELGNQKNHLKRKNPFGISWSIFQTTAIYDDVLRQVCATFGIVEK